MAKKAKVNKKVSKKAVKKSAAKGKKLGAVNPRPGSVAEIIVKGIRAKRDPEAIIKEVRKKHPDSKSGVKDVSWYKWRLGAGA